jgi:hypothetical protein
MSQSVLFSLLKTQFHAHRLCYCGQPYLFLWFIYYVHSGLRLFSMVIRWRFLPQVKFLCALLQMIRDFRSVTNNLALLSRGLLVSTFGVSLSSTLSSWHSSVLFRPDCPRSYLRFHYLSCASSNFNPVCRLVSRVIELRRLLHLVWYSYVLPPSSRRSETRNMQSRWSFKLSYYYLLLQSLPPIVKLVFATVATQQECSPRRERKGFSAVTSFFGCLVRQGYLCTSFVCLASMRCNL